MKQNQKETVLEIVNSHPEGIRTEKVKIDAMWKGVSCPDRYLRWLREEGKIRKESRRGDSTDTWYPQQSATMPVTRPNPSFFDKTGQKRIVMPPPERKTRKKAQDWDNKQGMFPI